MTINNLLRISFSHFSRYVFGVFLVFIFYQHDFIRDFYFVEFYFKIYRFIIIQWHTTGWSKADHLVSSAGNDRVDNVAAATDTVD